MVKMCTVEIVVEGSAMHTQIVMLDEGRDGYDELQSRCNVSETIERQMYRKSGRERVGDICGGYSRIAN